MKGPFKKMPIAEYPVIVVVIGLEGCPACAGYIPRFRAIAAKYARCVPSLVVAANQYNKFALKLDTVDVPCTHVLRYGQRTTRPLIGAGTDAQIERVFHAASQGLECAL